MPPKKRLRSSSSLLGDPHYEHNGNQSLPEDDSFLSFSDLHHHQTSYASHEHANVGVGYGQSSGSEVGGLQSGDGGGAFEGYNDSEHGLGGALMFGGQLATGEDDVAMIDEPTSDSSTPWLDYLHNNHNPYSPDLPFGLQLAHTSSLSTNAIINDAINDVDFTSLSNSDHQASNGSHQGDWQEEPWHVQHLDDYHFSSVADYNPSESSNNWTSAPAQQDNNYSESLSSLDPPAPALPFGIMPTSTVAATYPTPPLLPDIDTPPPALADPAPTQFNVPLMPSSTNYMIMGSENVGLVDFLRRWAHSDPPKLPVPDIRQVHLQGRRPVDEISYHDLDGDRCDIQGLNWAAMGVSREVARSRRHKTYVNYVNRAGSDSWTDENRERWLHNTENYFRFRKTLIRSDVNLAHFQLRSVLATPSRAQAFYPTGKGIHRLNPLTGKSDMVFDLGEFSPMNRAITTLDAACDVLVAGTFGGDYIIKSLHAQSVRNGSEGTITNPMCGITNHLQVHTQRQCGSPVAAISSNDRGFRVLDIETEQFISDFIYHFPLNCSAVSPDKRLRVLVGDTKDVAITNVETGDTEVELLGHRDYGFSCDWADDGFTVATGFQDKTVKIWDARKWTDSSRQPTPVSVWCEMAGARNLKFSPLGSGAQVLVSAEEADYINILDAKRGDPNNHRASPRGFQAKQTIDVFGEIGGISFGDEGHELNVLVSDPHRGGLVQLERAKLGSRKPTMIEEVPVF